ncbi:MAG: Gfo/Idh/MocA family oxidoreductase [bacterium JZ-2024 1]
MRAGVIGVGSMGKHHLRILWGKEDLEVVGFADINPKVIQTYTRHYRIPGYQDYHDLLKQGLDVVSVAVPTSAHKQVVMDCLRAGVHTLVEKPIAASLEDALEMAEEAKKQGITLMVGHIERFNPIVERIKQFIVHKRLGDPISISTARVSPYPTRITDVGIMMDFAIHDIDVISYLYGEKATSVYAVMGSSVGNHGDHASILMRFPNDRAGVIETSWLGPTRLRKILVIASEGFILGDFINQTIFYYEEGWSREKPIKPVEPLDLEISHFLECVSTSRTPKVTLEDSIYCLQVALLCEQSSSRHRTLSVPQTERVFKNYSRSG